MKNRNITFTAIFLALAFLALSPIAQAAPENAPAAPETALPNFNTADGQNALFSLTTGSANTAVGWFSLFSDTAGSFNTATGAGALLFNTSDSNTAFGAATLLFNTDGSDNTAVGTAALLNNTASGNTAIGSRALVNNTTGGTLASPIPGINLGPNVAVGWQALESNTVASSNTAVGYQALQSFTTGPVGLEQLGLCTAVGFQALANATGYANNAFGYQALYNNTDGTANTAIGGRTLFSNTTGGGNVANGASALFANNDGTGNTAIGFDALLNSMSGSGNTALGSSAGSGVTTASNVICIGSGVAGANVGASCYIGNIWSQSGGSQAVYVNSDGKLGAQVSSRRFKDDIKPVNQASEAIHRLRPVSFRYKADIEPTRPVGFGLIAEEVEKVNPDLVTRDKDGKPLSVRYDQVNAMLLNEFLKEHKRVEEQEATIAELKKAIAQLAARDKEQAAQIQKVSAQIKVSKFATGRTRGGAPARQLASNDY